MSKRETRRGEGGKGYSPLWAAAWPAASSAAAHRRVPPLRSGQTLDSELPRKIGAYQEDGPEPVAAAWSALGWNVHVDHPVPSCCSPVQSFNSFGSP